MTEKKEVLPVALEVVGVEDDDIKTKIDLAPDDFSSIFELNMFKKNYDKDTEKWIDDEKTLSRYNENLELLGGIPAEGATIEVYINDETGKAYVTPPSEFERAEKPLASDAGKLWLGAVISGVRDSAKGREVLIDYKDVTYSTWFNTGQWLDSKQKFILNKSKRAKSITKFASMFEAVEASWDNYQPILGLKVNLNVRKNALDPSAKYAWLELTKVEDVQYDQAMIQKINSESNASTDSIDISDDDMPF